MFRYYHVSFDSFLSILMIFKLTGGYIYQLVPEEFPFAVTSSEKRTDQKSLLLCQQLTELY